MLGPNFRKKESAFTCIPNWQAMYSFLAHTPVMRLRLYLRLSGRSGAVVTVKQQYSSEHRKDQVNCYLFQEDKN